jgi:hypothetical protein
MTKGTMKDIKKIYEGFIKKRKEITEIENAIKLYEQQPLIKKYMALQNQLDHDKKITSQTKNLNDYELLEYIINSFKIDNSNNIYVYFNSYHFSEEDDILSDWTLTTLNSEDEDFRVYKNIESGEFSQGCYKMEDCKKFEKKNIVLFPPMGIDANKYFDDIRNMYFKTAICEGNKKALEKIIIEKNNQNEEKITRK